MSAVHAERPRIRPLRVAVTWFLSVAALLFAACVVSGVAIEGWGSGLLAAAVIAVLISFHHSLGGAS